jgi:hypothetical protein
MNHVTITVWTTVTAIAWLLRDVWFSSDAINEIIGLV